MSAFQLVSTSACGLRCSIPSPLENGSALELCGHTEALPYVIPAFAGIHYEEAEAVGGDRLLSRAVGICPDFILGGDPLTVKIYEIET